MLRKKNKQKIRKKKLRGKVVWKKFSRLPKWGVVATKAGKRLEALLLSKLSEVEKKNKNQERQESRVDLPYHRKNQVVSYPKSRVGKTVNTLKLK